MKSDIIITKQEVHWFVADHQVQLLTTLGAYIQDEAFRKLVDELQSYVTEKFRLNGDGEIIDFFVTVLQKAGE